MDKDGLIDLSLFRHMMNKAFNKRITEANIGKIYKHVAGELSKKLNMEKFTKLVDIMQNHRYLFKLEPLEIWPWEKLKYFFKRYLKLDVIVAHWGFELVMFIFVIVNTAEMVWLMTEPEEPYLTYLNLIDDLMLYIFTAEFAVRILGTGFYAYFSDSWNKFDFTLLVISYATDILLDFLDFAKNARSARFLKISRLQKTLRITKSVKSFRIFKFCMGLLSSFYRIKQLLEIIIISLPAIWRTLSLILLIFYLWGCIGCELFRADILERFDLQPYGISDFYTYAGGILELAHIMIANGWSELMFNYCIRYNSRHSGQAFFISFHALVNIVLRSLLSGLVWEVFSFVDKSNNQENTDQHPNEIDVEELSKQVKKNYFSTLRFKSKINICDYIVENPKERATSKLKGLTREIKIEMGEDQRQKHMTQIKSRKSVQVESPDAFTKLHNKRLLEKRTSLTNPIPAPKSPISTMKDKGTPSAGFGLMRVALEHDLEKADAAFRTIPSINPSPVLNNRFAGLNLNYGISGYKTPAESSEVVVPLVKEEGNERIDKEISQAHIFIDSLNEIVSFSNDDHVQVAEYNTKPKKKPTELVGKGLLVTPIKPVNPPINQKPSPFNIRDQLHTGKKIDAKSILPQKPNSDSEEPEHADKEKFKLSKTPKNLPLNTIHTNSENSSDYKERLVIGIEKGPKRIQPESMSKKVIQKVK